MDPRTFPFWIWLIVSSVGGGAEACSVGLSTPGWTEPRGDIALLHGSPLDIFCRLNTSSELTRGYDGGHLRFYRDTELVTEGVHREGNSSIRLRVERPPKHTAMYYCKLARDDGEIAVCLNHVSVGNLPEPVEDFSCLSRNWQNLTCEWRAPPNFLRTDYSLQYRFAGRASHSIVYRCPHVQEDEAERGLFRCFWDEKTEPLYRIQMAFYFFNLTGSNAYGSLNQSIKLDHFAHLKPGPPVGLRAADKSAHSASLHWSVPFAMRTFSSGLAHRVVYRSEFDSPDAWTEADTGALPHKGVDFRLELPALQFAYAWYDVRISLRTERAQQLWSDFASVTFRTLGALPRRPPEVHPSSFEKDDKFDTRDVIVYWKRIAEFEQNGGNFSYEITATVDGKALATLSSKKAYVQFPDLPLSRAIDFIIFSRNDEGRSQQSTRLRVPASAELLPDVPDFTKTLLKENLYELSWGTPGAPDPRVKNYTVFWCDNARERPFQCEGHLQWLQVSGEERLKNITAPDEFLQFAISSEGEGSSSGLSWAMCTIIPDKLVGKIKNVWINRVGSSFMEVGLKLECADGIGVVQGYRVEYCPVDPYNKTCKGPKKNETLVKDPVTTYGNITNLNPYTMYSMKVSIITRHGEGQPSDQLINTTMEAAPSPPRDVSVSDISFSRLLVSWKAPESMNGILRFYRVNYDSPDDPRSLKVESAGDTEVVLTDLSSFTNYTISVEACTVACSNSSRALRVRTAIGSPGALLAPTVPVTNASKIARVHWQRPLSPGGHVDLYEIEVVEMMDKENTTHYFNTTETEFVMPFPNCHTEGVLTNFYRVRAINFDDAPDHGAAAFSGSEAAVTLPLRPAGDLNLVTYVGAWSPAVDKQCFTSRRTPPMFVVLLVIVFAIIASAALYYLVTCTWGYYKRMSDIHVSMPPGFDALSPKDGKFALDTWSSQGKHGKDHEKGDAIASADEVSLLNKGDGRSDKNDISVKTDSTTQSLTSSDTCKESPAARGGPLSEPPSASSSLRLRSVGGGSRPHSAASIEPVAWSSYPTRGSDQDELGLPPYSAVGVNVPDGYFAKAQPDLPYDSNGKSFLNLNFDKNPFAMDDDFSIGDTREPAAKQVPERTANGYVTVSSLPPMGAPLVALDSPDTPEAELPLGYVKAEARPPPPGSGYVSVTDSMLLAKSPASPAELRPVDREDRDLHLNVSKTPTEPLQRPGDVASAYCRFSWDTPEPEPPTPRESAAPPPHYLPFDRLY